VSWRVRDGILWYIVIIFRGVILLILLSGACRTRVCTKYYYVIITDRKRTCTTGHTHKHTHERPRSLRSVAGCSVLAAAGRLARGVDGTLCSVRTRRRANARAAERVCAIRCHAAVAASVVVVGDGGGGQQVLLDRTVGGGGACVPAAAAHPRVVPFTRDSSSAPM